MDLMACLITGLSPGDASPFVSGGLHQLIVPDVNRSVGFDIEEDIPTLQLHPVVIR